MGSSNNTIPSPREKVRGSSEIEQYVVQLDPCTRTWMATTPEGAQCRRSIWATAICLGRRLDAGDLREVLSNYRSYSKWRRETGGGSRDL